MLEQQIYSIESANINQETLVAMKNAGKAMKEIHGKMTMEDVDTTMFVALQPTISSRSGLCCLSFHLDCAWGWNADDRTTGNNYESSMSSRKKSAMPSQVCRSRSPLMKTSWRRIWRLWSKRSWTIRCYPRARRCRWPIGSIGSMRLRMGRVS